MEIAYHNSHGLLQLIMIFSGKCTQIITLVEIYYNVDDYCWCSPACSYRSKSEEVSNVYTVYGMIGDM